MALFELYTFIMFYFKLRKHTILTILLNKCQNTVDLFEMCNNRQASAAMRDIRLSGGVDTLAYFDVETTVNFVAWNANAKRGYYEVLTVLSAKKC